jgi:hypothetical protein
MAVTVAPGNLDSLLDMVIPLADYTGVAEQSFTAVGSFPNATLTSVNVTDTGPPGPGVTTDTTNTVVAVNDAQNTITLAISVGGQPIGTLTLYVVGYSPSAILVSGNDSNVDAGTLSGVSGAAGFNDISGIISGAPLSPGTAVAFTDAGSTTLTLTPTPIAPTAPTPTPSTSETDILLQNTDGSVALWQMSGVAIVDSGPTPSDPGPTWSAMGTGDFFDNGNTAIALQNDDGSVVLWDMSGGQIVDAGLVGNPGPTWHIKGTGDFFGDSRTDLVMQNADGSVVLWDMSGSQIVDAGLVGNPGASWSVEGTGAFFGHGSSAIAMQNADGSVVLWDMSGSQIIDAGLVGNPGPTWQAKGTGDFFGDGNSDLVMQNTDGSVVLWDMSGSQIVDAGLVGNPGPAWHVKGTGDFFGDGNTDLVMQNADGSVVLWDMSGSHIINAGVVGNPGATWNVLDDNMRFIYSTSANETLAATPTAPDEFVFTSFAAGSHTISGFNPMQDVIELSKAQFASFTDVQAATSTISGGAMINLGRGSSLLLPGVNPASLHASDFALA